MDRRSFIRLSTSGGAALLAGTPVLSCTDLSDTAFEPWNGPSSLLTEEDVRLRIVSYGLLAPSFKNSQPWWVDLKGDGITIRPEPHRFTPHLDPAGRQAMLSLGAFGETLSIAATHFGHQLSITLFPDQESGSALTENTTVATCLLEEWGDVPDALFPFIPLRRTNRLPFTGQELSQDHAGDLTGTIHTPSVTLVIIRDSDIVSALAELAHDCALEEVHQTHLRQEAAAKLRISDRHVLQERDGMTMENAGISLFDRWAYKLRSGLTGEQSDAIMDHLPGLIERQTSTAAAYGVLLTAEDTPVDQFNAGREMLRSQLQATALGVAFQPFSRTIEDPIARKKIASLAGSPDLHAQAIFRLGFADQVPPSPRRSLFEIVRI